MLKFGRVQLLTFGLGVQAFSYILMMAGISFSKSFLIPISIYLFEFTFTLSVGGVLYVYVVEILPEELIPISSIICWISKILISYFTLDFIHTFGIYTLFMFFFVCCVAGFFTLYGFAVETKGKKPSQIFNDFQRKGSREFQD